MAETTSPLPSSNSTTRGAGPPLGLRGFKSSVAKCLVFSVDDGGNPSLITLARLLRAIPGTLHCASARKIKAYATRLCLYRSGSPLTRPQQDCEAEQPPQAHAATAFAAWRRRRTIIVPNGNRRIGRDAHGRAPGGVAEFQLEIFGTFYSSVIN